MTDAFANLIPDARAFFTELAANNSKDWFDANRTRHAEQVRKPAELLADILAEDFGRLTGRRLTPKVYRINRDVRFSKDKSPYNTHLHILWSFAAEDRPGFFFALSPAYVSFAAGVMSFSSEGLDWVRRAIVDDPQPWLSTVASIRAEGGDLADWGEPPLKRVPKPWANDHSAADLLRRKSLILNLPLDAADTGSGLVPFLNRSAKALLPFWSCFDAGVAE
jgi:uncharacterized protein (TIGR02453 family)